MNLILAEKPSASKAIANALGKKKTKKFEGRVYYHIVNDGEIIVTSALGHLYNLYPTVTERGIYPKYDFHWVASWRIQPKNKFARFREKCFKCIKYLTQNYNFDKYIIGTDFDIEGTVIGFITFTALRIPLSKIYRMKMHSLAKYDIKKAYENLSPPDIEWFNAGFARHQVDILYGINLSEIFSKSASRFRQRWRTLSLGRVQTPTLKFIVDREREISSFKPQTYWNVFAVLEIEGKEYKAKHQKGDFWLRDEVNKLISKCKVDIGEVVDVIQEVKEQKPPYCFNISTLQQEAYYKLGFTPDFTDKIVQSLYNQRLVSYPRTGTTGAWGIPYKIILESMKGTIYDNYVYEILNKGYKMRKGGYHDGAHLALHPTAEKGEGKTDYERKLLELIRRRFIATFYPSLKRLHTNIKISLNDEIFELKGVKTIDEGWLKVYIYKKVEDELLPELKVGDKVKIKKLEPIEKQTTPPRRYTYASLIKQMEKEGIGTKATRAQICKLLWKRGYIKYERGKGIIPTRLGLKLIEITNRYAPLIIDVQLTKDLEKSLEMIEKGLKRREEVILKTKNTIQKILNDIEPNIPFIGKELAQSL